MTKIYALRNREGKTVSRITLVKYGTKVALVACDQRGEPIDAGYIAFISLDGLQRISYLTRRMQTGSTEVLILYF